MAYTFTQEMEDVLSSTLPEYMPQMIDNTFRSIPLAVRLIERDNVKYDGGSEIRQPFIFDKLPTGWYTGQDLLDITQKQTQTAMRFDWKFGFAGINIPMSELLLNNGKAAVTSLVTSKMQTGEISLRELIADSLFGDGTGSGGKEIIGLVQAVHDTGSYGGIARTSTEGAKLVSYVNSTGGDLSLATMQLGFGRATIEPERPDLIVTTQSQFNRLWSLVQANQRFAAAPGLLGEVGFQGINFNGATVVVDQSCPAGTMFFLNTKYMRMIFHSQRSFTLEGPFPVAGQDIRVWRLHIAMAFIVQSPRLNSKLTGLNETF